MCRVMLPDMDTMQDICEHIEGVKQQKREAKNGLKRSLDTSNTSEHEQSLSQSVEGDGKKRLKINNEQPEEAEELIDV